MSTIKNRIKAYVLRSKRMTGLCITLSALIIHGPVAARYKHKEFVRRNPKGLHIPYTISRERREAEENYHFQRDVKISIVVPLYNTPLDFLKDMIKSVTEQTYKNWELCLADGSTASTTAPGDYCRALSEKDSRIVYKRLNENKGISGNTNECLKMATGDYIALFDHDDYLHPSALFEAVKKICEENADYIYTDEATFFGENKDNIITCHYKPDFAFDNLIANNYICHFSVFSKDLLEKAGDFRAEYDGSQDHDLILRLTDKAENVAHIPKMLYLWRSHQKSVAMDISSKTYAIEAGKKAVHDFLKSKGIGCSVESSPAYPTIYRVKYEIKDNPKVSVMVLPGKETQKCLSSVYDLSTYGNYEIILAGDNENPNIKTVNIGDNDNVSKIKNRMAESADGEYLLFVSGDAAIISPEWIEELLMYAQRDDVAAVGGKLYGKGNTVMKGDTVLGLGKDGVAECGHLGSPKSNHGYMGKMFYAQDVSAVSGECMMIKRSTFSAAGGFDENLSGELGNLDLCLKLRQKGYYNVFNPFCELRYFGKAKEISAQKEIFIQKWGDTIKKGDPFYNPNLSLDAGYGIPPEPKIQ